MKLTKADVLSSLKTELKTMEELNKVEEPTEHEDYREPLELSKTTEVKVLLSWGGPEDGFKLRFDSDNDLISGKYYMANWGEYEEIELTEEELALVNDFYMVSGFVTGDY